jgi:hypothetical protein
MTGGPDGFVRRGGTGTLPTGERVVWSIADGARGRRWREMTIASGVMVRSVLLETDPAGRCTRLELATALGLLTLHPEPDDASLHGNVVGEDGVRHLRFDWSPRHELLIAGSPASAAIIRRTHAPAEDVPVLVIGDDLVPRPATVRPATLGSGLGDRGTAQVADGDGGSPDSRSWALELGPGP